MISRITGYNSYNIVLFCNISYSKLFIMICIYSTLCIGTDVYSALYKIYCSIVTPFGVCLNVVYVHYILPNVIVIYL